MIFEAFKKKVKVRFDQSNINDDLQYTSTLNNKSLSNQDLGLWFTVLGFEINLFMTRDFKS